jgi:hypothetical protein
MQMRSGSACPVQRQVIQVGQQRPSAIAEGFVFSEVASADCIIIRVAKGTDITHLTPTIKFNGVKIAPASDRPQDFTSGVRYTVTAQDGTTHTYYVAVRFMNQTKSILTFELRPAENPGLTETMKGHQQ